MGDFIGSGNFGQVYRGMEVESGKIIAVKIIPSSNSANKEIVASFEVNKKQIRYSLTNLLFLDGT